MKNYFKKFSIMFMMLFAILAVGLIQDNGYVANAATYENPSPEKIDGWNRYDDSDTRIKYTGKWSKWKPSTSYGIPCFKDTATSTPSNATNSPYCTFEFNGTKFQVVGMTYPDRSTINSVFVDGGKVGEFSLRTSSFNRSEVVYTLTGLAKGNHVVTINNSSNDGALGIDAIDIDEDGYLIDPNESIVLNQSSMNLNEGDLGQLTATTTPEGAQVTWTSSDTSIATVDSNGKVTGLKEGNCTITATTADGITAICTVNVTKKTEPTPTPEPTDSDKIVNIAHAKGDNTNNAGGDVTIIFHGTADTILSVVKTADVKDVWIGDNFTYTLVITNTGTKTAKAVVVNDPAPNHIDFNVSGVTTTQGTVDSSSTSKNIIVNAGDILPGGTVTIKIPSTVIA